MNCEYSLVDTPRVSESSPVPPNVNTTRPPKGLPQSQSVKIHDTYKNFIEDFTLEISTDWKRKPKRKRKVVDKFKQLSSKYVRLQRINLMCHLRCQVSIAYFNLYILLFWLAHQHILCWGKIIIFLLLQTSVYKVILPPALCI